jgi:hypothetical protein
VLLTGAATVAALQTDSSHKSGIFSAGPDFGHNAVPLPSITKITVKPIKIITISVYFSYSVGDVRIGFPDLIKITIATEY